MAKEEFTGKEPAKSWIYTVNNYTEEDIKLVQSLTDVTRHRCCKEVGEGGTPHLQGAITFWRAYRRVQLSKLVPRASWRVAKAVDAVNYCIKGEIIIDLTKKDPRKRVSEEIADDIRAGKKVKEILKDHLAYAVIHARAISSLMTILKPDPPSWRDVTVLWIAGPTGTGKTKLAMAGPSVYRLTHQDRVWFDGYDGQERLVIDELSVPYIPFNWLLQLLDGYPITLPIKGGFADAYFNEVYITSNRLPFDVYKDIPDHRQAALARRISHSHWLS